MRTWEHEKMRKRANVIMRWCENRAAQNTIISIVINSFLKALMHAYKRRPARAPPSDRCVMHARFHIGAISAHCIRTGNNNNNNKTTKIELLTRCQCVSFALTLYELAREFVRICASLCEFVREEQEQWQTVSQATKRPNNNNNNNGLFLCRCLAIVVHMLCRHVRC